MQEIMRFIGNHPILIMAWVGILSTLIISTFQNWLSKVSYIACDEAIRMINKEEALIIDLRYRDDYLKGHIANSLNLTVSDIISGNLDMLEKMKSKSVIIVCANGTTSRDAAKNMMNAGFKRVYVLKEGISGWDGENLPLIRSS